MKTLIKILILLLIFIPVVSKANNINRNELRKRPKSIEEAINHLYDVYTEPAINQIKQFNEEYFVWISNNSIGGYIIPHWFQNFVSQTKLTKDFEKHGIENYQDMAVILYRSFYRKLNNLPVEFEKQIEIIRDYNKNKNDSTWLEKYNNEFTANYMNFYNVGDTIIKHIGYNYNYFKVAKKTAIVKSLIIDKSVDKVKIKILSIDNAENEQDIFEKMEITDTSNIWIDPFAFQRIKTTK